MFETFNLLSFLSQLSLLLFHLFVCLIDALCTLFNLSSGFLEVSFWNFSLFSDCFNLILKTLYQLLFDLNSLFKLFPFLIVELFWIISFKIFLIEIIDLTSKILVCDVQFSDHVVVFDPIFLSFLKFFCLRSKLFAQIFMFNW